MALLWRSPVLSPASQHQRRAVPAAAYRPPAQRSAHPPRPQASHLQADQAPTRQQIRDQWPSDPMPHLQAHAASPAPGTAHPPAPLTAQPTRPPPVTARHVEARLLVGRVGPSEGAPDWDSRDRAAFETTCADVVRTQFFQTNLCRGMREWGPEGSQILTWGLSFDSAVQASRRAYEELTQRRALIVRYNEVDVRVPVDSSPPPAPPSFCQSQHPPPAPALHRGGLHGGGGQGSGLPRTALPAGAHQHH